MADEHISKNEKSIGVSSTVRSVSDSSPTTGRVVIPQRHLTRAIWTIVTGVALPCIPILIIVSLLLYLIFRHRIVLNPGWPALQAVSSQNAFNSTEVSYAGLNLGWKLNTKAAYYVQYNPSTITTIASWTSRIIPYLSSSIMALVAFFAARHIVLKSKQGKGSDLPNPEQLTLLISVLGGSGFNPLMEALHYRFYRNGRLISPLPAAFSALALISILSIAISLIDTWFGVATEAAIITQLYPRLSPSSSYGFKISNSVCPNGPGDNSLNFFLENKSAFWPCDVYTVGFHPLLYLQDTAEASRITQDNSKEIQVRQYTDASNTSYHYLGHPSQDALLDFQAKTFATSSQCVPMTQLCYFNFAPGGKLFNCTPAFSGDLGGSYLNASAAEVELPQDYLGEFPNVGLAFAQNPELTIAGESNRLVDSSHPDQTFDFPKIYTTNPLYYGAWAIGFPIADQNLNFDGDTGIWYDSGLGRLYGDGGVWVLNCSTTVYDVTYNWVNGAVNSFNTTKSSTDLSAFLSSPFALSSYISTLRNPLDPIGFAAGNYNNSREISETFAEQFSRYLLAYSKAAIEPQINEYEQVRNSTISVARIPLIPLYLMLATKAIYVLAVIVLAVGAYCFTHPAETDGVKAQLSVKGLAAAARFDDPELLQSNIVAEMQEHLTQARIQSPEEKEREQDHINSLSEGRFERANTGPMTRTMHSSEPKMGPQRANTGPMRKATQSSEPAKVGILPGADGNWKFVTF